MRVLSLFDGIACGYEALQRAWIPIDVYYASEIDKYAIQIAQKNHPDIIQLGDVCEIKGGGNLKDIDLIMWGSPCQGFSIAGKMLNFNDPRSKLFFEFVRLVKEIKPKYFLLENVKMKKEWIDIISSELWVQPIEINSGLVSAQNRRRLYRTNIPGVSQPKDKGILLKDILQHEVDEKYMFSKERRERIVNWKYDILKRLEDKEGKCATLVTNGGGNHEKKIEVSYSPGSREFESNWRKDDKVPTLLARDYKDPKVVKIPNELVEIVDGEVRIKQATKKGYIVAEEGDGISFSFNDSSSSRSRMGEGKANTLTCNWDSSVYSGVIRKLTPIECERLQTLPDNYTAWVSDSQRYKALGNWRTVDVIAHIFSFMNK